MGDVDLACSQGWTGLKKALSLEGVQGKERSMGDMRTTTTDPGAER